MNIAKQVLDTSANGDATTADELASAAEDLRKAVGFGLGTSHPLAVEATELEGSLREKGIKMAVSAWHAVSMFEGMCRSCIGELVAKKC